MLICLKQNYYLALSTLIAMWITQCAWWRFYKLNLFVSDLLIKQVRGFNVVLYFSLKTVDLLKFFVETEMILYFIERCQRTI